MRKTIILTISILSTCFAIGQNYNTSADWAKIDVMQKVKKNLDENIPKDVQGSMYYIADFKPGNLYFENNRLDREFEYRYNAYKDEIEVKSQDGQDILSKSPKLSIEIFGSHFKYVSFLDEKSRVNFGYMRELVANSDYTVYQKDSKVFKQGKKSMNGMTPDLPSKLIDQTNFYIQFTDSKSAILFPDNKKDLMKMYPELKNGLKKFIKSEKIDFDKSEDVLKVMDYCYAK